MKVLVPMPFNLTNLAHGRNLRIAYLLRELAGRCRMTCLVPEPTLARVAQSILPDICVETVAPKPDNREMLAQCLPISGNLSKAFSFLGYSSELLADVYRRASAFDAVLGFDLPSVIYLLTAARAKDTTGSPRVVGDLIDDPALLRKSLPLRRRWSPTGWKTAWSIGCIRKHALPNLDALVAVTPLDAQTLSSTTGRPVHVVPNGVQVRSLATERTEPLAVFTGAMDFPPNETAAVYLARRIWPLVWRKWRQGGAGLDSAKTPSIALAIVGANPTLKVRALAEIPGVTVTGYVDDMASWLTRARVALAPMVSGSGIKNKVLEACAAGCPVVATSLGAAALPVDEKHGLWVEDQPERFAERVQALLADTRAARAAGLAAREMVHRRFSWSRMADLLMTVLTGEDRPKYEILTARSAEGLAPSPTALHEEAFAHAAS